MKKILIILGVLIVAIVVFILVRGKSGEESENFAIGTANVSSVTPYFKESFPVQVGLLVEGEFPDSCTVLGDVMQGKDGDASFSVTLQTKRPLDAFCGEVITPFSTDILLEGTNGLVAGEYTVNVNGVSTTFRFDVDNFISLDEPLK